MIPKPFLMTSLVSSWSLSTPIWMLQGFGFFGLFIVNSILKCLKSTINRHQILFSKVIGNNEIVTYTHKLKFCIILLVCRYRFWCFYLWLRSVQWDFFFFSEEFTDVSTHVSNVNTETSKLLPVKYKSILRYKTFTWILWWPLITSILELPELIFLESQ